MSDNGFLSKLLWRDAGEDELSTYSVTEIGTRRSKRREEPKEEQQPRDFTVERAAEIIDDLPPDVSQESAARIVRGALVAAGIELSNFDRSTRAQVSKLSSEIEAWEGCDGIVGYEEEKISHASDTLEEVRRVRAFFDLLKTEEEETPNLAQQGIQVLEPFDVATTQVKERSGPLEATDRSTTYEPSEDSSAYRVPSDASTKR